MKSATGSAIDLVTTSDYNMYFYNQLTVLSVGILIGVVLGCHFWGWLFDRIG